MSESRYCAECERRSRELACSTERAKINTLYMRKLESALLELSTSENVTVAHVAQTALKARQISQARAASESIEPAQGAAGNLYPQVNQGALRTLDVPEPAALQKCPEMIPGAMIPYPTASTAQDPNVCEHGVNTLMAGICNKCVNAGEESSNATREPK